VNMVRAIEKSTNTYFYRLALDMGIDRFSSWMSRFSFGSKTGIDLVGESEGILPSREWKAAHSKQGWFPGETVIAGIGQGYWEVTPLQLAHAVATLADHGVPYLPRLGMATKAVGVEHRRMLPNPALPSLIHKAADWNVVDEGMRAVVTGGTGKGQFTGFPYVVAGKSGTAERFSRTSDAYDTNKNKAYLASRHRAWFIAYAPADNPQIAAAVVLEAGAWGGSDAGPIVRKIFDAWLATHDGSIPGAQRLPASTVAAPSSPAVAPVPAHDGNTDDNDVEDLPAQPSSSGVPP
jgi:penicillin-binding protein 2